MAISDPYTILGVSKSASADEIKRAYRKQAHKYHPDKKGGDEAKFKEVNEAYQILSDPQKKAGFDRFGHSGAQGGFGGDQSGHQGFGFDMGGMGSIFDMFTGGGFGSPGSQRAEKGEDLHLRVSVNGSDPGKDKVYEYDAFDACTICNMSGVAPGSEMVSCKSCGGQGRIRQQVRTPFGTFSQVGLCATCEGMGKTPKEKCRTCGGTGRKKSKRKLEIHIPKDMPDRYLMAFPMGGNAGQQGAPGGDLTIVLEKR